MTTEPTDAEIDAVTLEVLGYAALDKETNETARDIARAVIAKWGQPSGAGVPVGEVQHLHELNDVWLQKLPIGTKLYTTPQPTQAQSGAVPLTDEQINELDEDGVFLGNCKEIVRSIEAAHGITQNGGSNAE